MANTSKFIAMIPARIGSNRLKYKNLALLNGKPLIYYAIEAAKKSNCFDKIYINSDHNIFEKIAQRYKVNFYLRPKKLGGNNIKSDDVVYDFINKFNSKFICWVNPIAPLQQTEEIKKAMNLFKYKKIDSLFSIYSKKVHFLKNAKPLNFNKAIKFQQTQSLLPVSEMTYSIMAWRTKTFVNAMKKNNYAFFCGKTEFFLVSQLSSMIIKNHNDLKLAAVLMKQTDTHFNIGKIKYDNLINKI